MPDINVAVVALLDTSDTMHAAMPLVIIDGKALVRSGRPGDEIAVVQFQDIGSMVYPPNTAFATVDPQMTVTAEAAAAIGELRARGNTNMKGAVVIANQILATASLPTRAYMMLTDGCWYPAQNDPTQVVPTEIPLFICGMGPFVDPAMMRGLLAKNPGSKYLAAPNAHQVMVAFNSIRGMAAEADVTVNQIRRYQGTDYSLTPVRISSATEECQFSVVWSNGALSYTPDPIPDPKHVNIVLIDPAGNSTGIRPAVADPGYAIFNIMSPQPGEWQILTQYAAQSGTYATIAGFEYDTNIHLELDTPVTARVGEPLTIRARLTGDASDRPSRIAARVQRPRHDIHALLDSNADAIRAHLDTHADSGATRADDRARVNALTSILQARSADIDLSEQCTTLHTLTPSGDGTYCLRLDPPSRRGDYTISATARVGQPDSPPEAERTAMASVMI